MVHHGDGETANIKYIVRFSSTSMYLVVCNKNNLVVCVFFHRFFIVVVKGQFFFSLGVEYLVKKVEK